MSQYLLLPFDRQMMLCGYKNPQYRAYWKYDHYGADISTHQGSASQNHKVYASGDGIVTAVGRDNSLGYGICITYLDCVSRDGKHSDLVARYMHLKSCLVTKGQTVNAGTPIGEEGKEGTTDYHLHIELDTDTSFPTWTPQVSAGHSLWKKGKDSTVNPSLWLWQAKSRTTVPPTYNPAWLNAEDFGIPFAEEQQNDDRRIEALTAERDRYKRLYEAYRSAFERAQRELSEADDDLK